MSSSVETIREKFPALSRTYLGHRVAYFDGPGGTQVPHTVVQAMSDYLLHHNANLGWGYPTSKESDEALASARGVIATFLNAEPDTVVFGNNMTTLTFHAARALGREWAKGDEIIVTELDHHANVDPWRDVAKERGLTIRTVRMDPVSGGLRIDHLENLVGRRTKLIAVGAASNALGTVTDIGRVCCIARSAGAVSFIDAVHSAPHILPNVSEVGCDFLACSSYKFYGPHAGILFGRKELLARLNVPRLEPAPSTGPARMETGTQNHEGIVGARAAVEFLGSLSDGPHLREKLHRTYTFLHERAASLTALLWDGLAENDKITLYGPSPGSARTPTVSFTVRGLPAGEVSRRLARRGLFLSFGDFYAMTVVHRLGIEGLVRAGMACYSTVSEVHRLVRGVEEIASGA